MTLTDSSIALAALEQFGRYGLRKTTMQDVADGAGISRQTLYNRVPNKDALLRLVVQYYFDDSLQRCDAALAQCTTLDETLSCFITHFAKEPWQMIHAMPEAEEIEKAATSLVAEEMAIATRQKEALISNTLIDRQGDKIAEAEAQHIAAFFCATAAGIKTAATSQTDLDNLCATFQKSIRALL